MFFIDQSAPAETTSELVACNDAINQAADAVVRFKAILSSELAKPLAEQFLSDEAVQARDCLPGARDELNAAVRERTRLRVKHDGVDLRCPCGSGFTKTYCRMCT